MQRCKTQMVQVRSITDGFLCVNSSNRLRVANTLLAGSLSIGGIRFVNDSSSADLLVSFAVGRRETLMEAQPKTFLNSVETGRFDSVSHDFSESQLSINLIDRATGRLAWYGSSSKSLSGSDQANIEQVVNRLVGAILKKFPPDT